MVRLTPICTETGVPSIVIVVLPLRYQPSEPVENSLTGATMGMPLIVISTGLACSLNCLRLIGQVVLTAMISLLDGKKVTAASYPGKPAGQVSVSLVGSRHDLRSSGHAQRSSVSCHPGPGLREKSRL